MLDYSDNECSYIAEYSRANTKARRLTPVEINWQILDTKNITKKMPI